MFNFIWKGNRRLSGHIQKQNMDLVKTVQFRCNDKSFTEPEWRKLLMKIQMKFLPKKKRKKKKELNLNL